MKKILLLLPLVLAIAVIPGYKQPRPNETIPYKESQSSTTASDEKPKILLMLTNETGQKKWNPSLWWSYQHSKTIQPGC
jgi:hypothetical protein